MKNYLRSIMISGAVILAIGCGDHNSNKEEGHSHHEETKLVLDNGQKWIANPETTASIQEMILLMNEFEKTEDFLDYHLLEEKLEIKFKYIFEKCTMEGESHEQLHNYMLPMKKLLTGLTNEDISICESSYDELNIHLSEYKEFFE